MGAYIPLFCLMFVTILLWRTVLSNRSLVWTRARVAAASAAAFGALTVPFVVIAFLLT